MNWLQTNIYKTLKKNNFYTHINYFQKLIINHINCYFTNKLLSNLKRRYIHDKYPQILRTSQEKITRIYYKIFLYIIYIIYTMYVYIHYLKYLINFLNGKNRMCSIWPTVISFQKEIINRKKYFQTECQENFGFSTFKTLILFITYLKIKKIVV